MIKVWVLVVLLNNGHFINGAVPTLEFSTEARCEAAIDKMKKIDKGTVRAYCLELEK